MIVDVSTNSAATNGPIVLTVSAYATTWHHVHTERTRGARRLVSPEHPVERRREQLARQRADSRRGLR